MHSILKMTLNVIKALLMLLMIAMFITVCYGVISRYIFKSAAIWTGELSTYILIWLTFLGAAWCVFEKTHISFDSLIEKFPPAFSGIIRLLLTVSMLIFVCLMSVYGYKVMLSSINDSALTFPVSKGVIYAVIPISGILMAIGFLMQLYEIVLAQFTGKKQATREASNKKEQELDQQDQVLEVAKGGKNVWP